jgi:hypothetical protein
MTIDGHAERCRARGSGLSPREDSSLEDIAYHLYVRAQVEKGVRDLDEDRVVPHES